MNNFLESFIFKDKNESRRVHLRFALVRLKWQDTINF